MISGSVGVGIRMRARSMATLRVMAKSHVATRPRRASYVAAWRHARRKVSCATSSAASGSPSIVTASPNTRPWKRRMNVAAASGFPAPSPASNLSSGIAFIQYPESLPDESPPEFSPDPLRPLDPPDDVPRARTACHVKWWPPRLSLNPSPVALPGRSSANVYSGLPSTATCMLPSGRLTTPILPAPAPAFGFAELVVSGFQNDVHAALVHTSLPLASWSEG